MRRRCKSDGMEKLDRNWTMFSKIKTFESQGGDKESGDSYVDRDTINPEPFCCTHDYETNGNIDTHYFNKQRLGP